MTLSVNIFAKKIAIINCNLEMSAISYINLLLVNYKKLTIGFLQQDQCGDQWRPVKTSGDQWRLVETSGDQ